MMDSETYKGLPQEVRTALEKDYSVKELSKEELAKSLDDLIPPGRRVAFLAKREVNSPGRPEAGARAAGGGALAGTTGAKTEQAQPAKQGPATSADVKKTG